MANSSYLKPKVGAPAKLRSERNGQFVNPPLYMTLGGMSSSGKIRKGKAGDQNLALERGGPKAKQGRPI